MKLYFLILIISLSTTCSAQSESQTRLNCIICQPDSLNFEITLEPDFFMLGFLFDYGGRFEIIDRKDQVDIYHRGKDELAALIVLFVDAHYGITLDTIRDKFGVIKSYSSRLANRLNKYYDRHGKIKDASFDSDTRIYSFLLGNYLRYGKKLTEKAYSIKLWGSPKDDQVYRMLKHVNCDKVLYVFGRDFLDQEYKYYFEASPRLIKYFNSFRVEKERLDSSFVENNSGYKKYPELKLREERRQAAELEWVTQIFK